MPDFEKTTRKLQFEMLLFFRGLWHNFKAVEVSLTSLAFWWAFILLLPYDTFTTSTSYSAMNSLASEEIWGAGILVIATINLVGLAKSHKRIRMIGLLLAMALWIFVATMFAVSNLLTTATGTYVIIACINAYLYVKVGEGNGR